MQILAPSSSSSCVEKRGSRQCEGRFLRSDELRGIAIFCGCGLLCLGFGGVECSNLYFTLILAVVVASKYV
jgi:hypothetical protein